MLTFLILIFFLKLLCIYFYIYPPEDVRIPRLPYKYAKICYVSSISMIGGLITVIIFYLFSMSGDYSGNIKDIFKGYKWSFSYDLYEFFFGYFLSLIIIFLKNCKIKFK